MGRPERIVEDYLRKICKKNNILCYKFTSPGHAGVPDDVLIANERTVFCECKSETGKLRKIQEYRIKEMREHGATVYVCNTRELVDEMLLHEFGVMKE